MYPPVDTTNLTASPAACTLAPRRTILGKRPRGTEDTSGDSTIVHNNIGHDPRTIKRRMAVNGVLEVGGSTSRDRHKPATRTLLDIHSKSEAMGRGAERLAATNALEVYHQSLPGPSVQRALVGTTACGQSSWIEGREEEITQHGASSVVQQPEPVAAQVTEGENEEGEAEEASFTIPKLGEDSKYKMMLNDTPGDLARGTICRLCPDSAFSNWDGFKRHCDSSDKHPFMIHFCRHCGDFFARSDARKRHEAHRPPECRAARAADAEMKRTGTEAVHAQFKMELKESLQNDEVTVMDFSLVIKGLYPNTSKRGSRMQTRRKAPRS
jgi:hypothetical protein